VFHVELAGDDGGPTPIRERAHGDDPFVGADPDRQPIADTQRPCRFDPLVVDLDLAAFDRLRGQRASLEEARGPQPLVDAYAARFGVVRVDGRHGFRSAASGAARLWYRLRSPPASALGCGCLANRR